MIKKCWTIIFILILLIPLMPREVHATTLREYEEALEKYKNELDSTNYQISEEYGLDTTYVPHQNKVYKYNNGTGNSYRNHRTYRNCHRN